MDAHDQTTEPQPEAPEPRRLYRSEERVIAGVCGGVARYFGLDPALVRIIAVALALFGGAGLLLYVAGLLLMPDSPDGEAPIGGAGGRPTALAVVGVGVLLLIGWPLVIGGGLAVAGLLVPLAVLALAGLVTWWLVSGEGPSGSAGDVVRRSALGLGVLLVCFLLFVGAAWAAGAGGGTVAAILVIVAGVVLVAGAFVGRVRGLILPALTVALAVGFVSAAGIDLDGGVGEREYAPASASELRERYELGMGELVVDLRNTELPAGDTPVALDIGVGSAEVYVPEDVCVATSATVGMGAVEVFDRDNGGVDLDWEDRPSAPRDGKRLVVDADVGLGALQVHHSRAAGHHDHGPRFGRDDFGSDEKNSGCA